jgi:hypothetical protein
VYGWKKSAWLNVFSLASLSVIMANSRDIINEKRLYQIVSNLNSRCTFRSGIQLRVQ